MKNSQPPVSASAIHGQSILVLTAHPGDAIRGCGGSIALHRADAIPVRLLGFATTLSTDPADVTAATRAADFLACSRALGCDPAVLWDDAALTYGEQWVQRLVDYLRLQQIDLLYAPSPLEFDPDRRALAMLAIEAVRRVGAPCRVALYEIDRPLSPNVIVDISAVAEQRQQALQQITQADNHLSEFRASQLHAPASRAEAFCLADAAALLADPLHLYASEYQQQTELGLAVDIADQPLVSIMIRSMGRPELQEALDSIALQTYRHIEVVVINARGPGHPTLPAWCGTLPLRFVDTPAGLRRSAAANRGLDEARGDWLMFLDDDDWLAPNHIAKLVTGAQQTSLQAVYSDVITMTPDRQPAGITFATSYARFRLLGRNFLPIHSVLFARTLLTHGCRFDHELDFCEDWDFWLQISEHTAYQRIPGVSAYYRVAAQSGVGGKPVDQHAIDGTARVVARWWGKLDLKNLYDMSERVELSFYHQHASAEQARMLHEERLSSGNAIAEMQQKLAQQLSETAAVSGELVAASHRRDHLQTELAHVRAAHHQLIEHHQAAVHARELRIAHLENVHREQEQIIGQTALRLHQAAHQSEQALQFLAGYQRLLSHAQEQQALISGQLLAARRVAQQQQQQLHALRQQLQAVYASTSWRLTRRLRSLRGGGADNLPEIAPLDLQQSDALPSLPEPAVAHQLPLRLHADGYWTRGDDRLDDPQREAMRAIVHTWAPWPALGIVVLARNTPLPVLRRCLDSLVFQLYPKFEAWVIDLGSEDPGVIQTAAEYAARDGRVRYLSVAADVGPAVAAQSGADAITADWKIVLDAAEHLAEATLFRVAKRIADQRPAPAAAPPAHAPLAPVGGEIDYAEWIRRYDTITPLIRGRMLQELAVMPHRPLLSIVMPVYNTPLKWLRRALFTVLRQIYPNWELCIADDRSSKPQVRRMLERFMRLDSRIKVVFRQENGHISAASNSALEIARGEFMVLMDHDDELPPHALFCVAREINRYPDAQLIYSDEDKLDVRGKRLDPYFKPDFNPDLLLSHNVFSHLGVYRMDLVRKIGGFRIGLEGSQDYDLVLRAIEQTPAAQIRHIPHVLYHWRMIEGSAAVGSDQKPYAYNAAERALSEHLQRTGVKAEVLQIDDMLGNYRIKYALPETPPQVSIIIPTRNGLGLLARCMGGLLERTTYPNREIIIIDNGSDDPATLGYLATLQRNGSARVVRDDSPFNYAALNNRAVELANGDMLCFLNNDIDVISPDWLEEMVSQAARPGVGAVGSRLWYPHEALQHGGVVLGLGGVAGHIHHGMHRGHFGYFGRARLTQNFSAVSAACMVMPKAVFQEVGGFDAEHLAVAFNDVDLCLRVRQRGYHIVWTPNADLYHFESATRGADVSPAKRARYRREIDYMMQTWGEWINADPYYNPNLALHRPDYVPANPPRISLV